MLRGPATPLAVEGPSSVTTGNALRNDVREGLLQWQMPKVDFVVKAKVKILSPPKPSEEGGPSPA